MPLKLMLIKSTEEFRLLEPVWNDLLSRSRADNYFLTWDWLWNWWRIFARDDDKLSILTLEEGGEIVAIAPFYVRRRLLRGIYPVRRMMYLGTQEEGEGDVGSDYMDVICRAGEESAAVKTFLKTVTESNICDEIYLSKMDTSSKTFDLLREEAAKLRLLTLTANEYVSPYIQLPSTWDDYLKSLSSSMRWNIKNERRKLQNCQNIVFRKVEDAADLTRDFDQLVKLHENRWASNGIEGAFSNETFTMFHKNIMKCMMQNGNLDLVLLSEDDKSRAAVYNIYYKNKICVYQTGRYVDDRKIAFGYLLHCHCIEEAIKKGLTEYDFLPKGKTDDYKDRFAKSSRKVADLYMARQWAVKHFVRAEESARAVYHRVKPYLQKVK